ncbi:hypothetical protein EDB86DRAFT_3217998 [Lactarius hatsudake]|nr:hypothetical protein EDB86DRAFT_3217998 [Lactarius hatsudake]
MPLLSGPAPPAHDSSRADSSCRKCNKEFNIVFTRARKCNHCGVSKLLCRFTFVPPHLLAGFSYCSSCSDYQALMPREGSGGSGYDPVHVCAFCIENLNITAGGRNYLRGLSLARLKKYVDAYNIKTEGVLEKDDLIEKIIAVRVRNGCLPYSNESFYRKHSVPNGRTGRPRGLFSRRDEPRPVQPTPPRQQPINTSSEFPRPDLDPSRQHTQPHRATPRPQDSPQAQPSSPSQPHPPPRTTPPAMDPRPQSTPSTDSPASYPRPNTTNPPPSRGPMPTNGNWTNPSNTPASAPPPPPSIPTLDELLAMTDGEVSQMSISALKTVLFQNHVNARLLLEKRDLVERVHALLGDERQERAREAAIHAREEEATIARQHAMMEEQRLREEQARQEREQAFDARKAHASGNDAEQPRSKVSPPPMMGTAADLERNGLCVVCQDEEANIAIVDCGHLAMCRSCSDLIMSSSRECPLCRTRIVTEARLLRIFKT